MRRAGLLLGIFILLGAIALYTGRPLLFNLTYVVGLTLVLSFGWAWSSVHWIRVRRELVTEQSQVGEYVEERFIAENSSFLPKLWLEMRDESEMPGHNPSQVLNSIPPRHERGWVTKTLCRKRGRFRMGPAQMISGDPLGLFKFTRQLPEVHNLVVYPAVVPLPNLALPMGRLTGGEAVRRRTHYVTPSAAGVRDYVQGDSYNRIHWPSSVRKGRLIVKEFELDPATDVWLILDLHTDVQAIDPALDILPKPEPAMLHLDKGEPQITPTTEEYVVTIAASLAHHFLLRHRSVGLLAYGQHREVIQADRGLRQLNRLLQSLAVLQAEGHVPLFEVLTIDHLLFGRGTTAIAISPSPDIRWIKALRTLKDRGIRPVAVMIDPASFDAGYRGAMLHPTVVEKEGTPTYWVRKDDDLALVLAFHRTQLPERN